MDLLREAAADWGIDLVPEQIEQFERYYRELITWNQRLNLTRITDYQDVQLRHFLDSLSLLRGMDPHLDASLIDVGAGAGLPGLPLRIARPDLHVTLVESTGKKADFLRHVVQALDLDGVEVLAERAETAARDHRHRETYAFATARALADLPVALELTLPFVRIGGRALLPRRGDLNTGLRESKGALAKLGGRHVETLPVQLPGIDDDGRAVLVIEKVEPTQPVYPRRPGIPAKRPLR